MYLSISCWDSWPRSGPLPKSGPPTNHIWPLTDCLAAGLAPTWPQKLMLHFFWERVYIFKNFVPYWKRPWIPKVIHHKNIQMDHQIEANLGGGSMPFKDANVWFYLHRRHTWFKVHRSCPCCRTCSNWFSHGSKSIETGLWSPVTLTFDLRPWSPRSTHMVSRVIPMPNFVTLGPICVGALKQRKGERKKQTRWTLKGLLLSSCLAY